MIDIKQLILDVVKKNTELQNKLNEKGIDLSDEVYWQESEQEKLQRESEFAAGEEAHRIGMIINDVVYIYYSALTAKSESVAENYLEKLPQAITSLCNISNSPYYEAQLIDVLKENRYKGFPRASDVVKNHLKNPNQFILEIEDFSVSVMKKVKRIAKSK